MSNEANEKTTNGNEIEFNPLNKVEDLDKSLDFINFEFDEEEILKVYDTDEEWNEFFTEKEYQSLLEEYIEIKKSNINVVYSNPLYFIKKIIYFYQKETFFDSFLLTLKSPSKNKKKPLEKCRKTISFEAKFDKEDEQKAHVDFDLKNKKFNVILNPDNKLLSLTFDVNKKSNNILIHINDYDENNNKIVLIPKLIESQQKKLINNKKVPSNNEIDTGKGDSNYKPKENENKAKVEFNSNHNSSDKININEASNSNSNSISNSLVIQKENNSNELLSYNETLISYDEKDCENLKILVRENNDNLLKEFHREKIEGVTYESIANKTFELMCNLSLNRNIEVKNYISKRAKNINIFFNLKGDKKIRDFQIDSYVSKITGKELNKIRDKFPNNFFFFENLNLKDHNNYEIIGEISQNILNNSRQKISQQFNYIHLIKEFNEYKQKENNKFISLCKDYGFNNYEKIFILITDGSFIRSKYLINILNNNKSEIESLINQNKEKKEIINVLSGYFKDNKVLDLLEINIERFYNFCIFYNNLKSSGIKFCFCFISDIIEDKLENVLEEKLKLYKNNDKDIEQKLEIKEESKGKKQKNEFMERIIETIERNNKLKSNLMIISNKINRKIKDFVHKKNDIFKKIDDFFIEFSNKNEKIFFDISILLITDLKNQDSFFKDIYVNKMFFFFVLLFPEENAIKINEIKNTIKNKAKGLSFEVIKKDDIDKVDNHIKSQNIKDKIKIKVFISNNEEKIYYLVNKFSGKNNYSFFLLENNTININLSDIIKNNFKSAIDLYISDFYQNKKSYFPDAKKNNEILSKNNIIKKIKYDLNLLKIKTNNIDTVQENISFNFIENEEFNEQLVKLGKQYYDSILNMIKELLDVAKIKKDNNVMNFFINQKKFFAMFNNLAENIKYKCFYRYFLFNHIKSMGIFYNQINLEKLTLENII